MAGGTQVASFFGLLGLKVDKAAWKRGNDQIAGMKSALVGLGAYFGARAAGKALIGFNAHLETARVQVAGMLALAKGTDLADQYASADTAIKNLQRRAKTLPGTTSDYINMLAMIAQPVTDAKVGLQGLEDLSVSATVAAKALGVEWEVAGRDIDQALRGQFKSVDQLTGKILGSIGYKGEEGRARFNAQSAQKRASELQRGFGQKQIAQLAEAQSGTFTGLFDTFKAEAAEVIGKIGIPLFKALGAAIKRVNAWLTENAETVTAVGEAIGGALAGAFELVSSVIGFFIENSDLAIAAISALAIVFGVMGIAAAAAWLAATWPIIAIIAAITAIVFAIRKVLKHSDKIKAAFRVLWNGVKRATDKIVDTFVGVGLGIKDAFRTAFDWVEARVMQLAAFIANTPGIKQILKLGGVEFDTKDADPGYAAYLKEVHRKGGFAMMEEDWVKQGRPKGPPQKPSAQAPSALAPTVRVPVAGRGGGSGVNINGDTNITMSVNAGPGMDEVQLANKAGEIFETKTAEVWQRLAFNHGVTR